MKRGTSFCDSKVAFEETVKELARLNIVDGVPCQCAVEFIEALAPQQVQCYLKFVSVDWTDVPVDIDRPVLFVYRLSERSDRNSIPLQLRSHKLFAVFAERENLSEFYFRWSSAFRFWKCRRLLQSQENEKTNSGGSDEVGLKCSNWQILVHVNDVNAEAMKSSLKMALGGQEKMLCSLHNRFLLKQSVHCRVACCVVGCDRNARWCCFGKTNPCRNGVCYSHGRDFMRSDLTVEIEQELVVWPQGIFGSGR